MRSTQMRITARVTPVVTEGMVIPQEEEPHQVRQVYLEEEIQKHQVEVILLQTQGESRARH